MSTVITSRTIADVVREDGFLMEKITPEQFHREGAKLDNEGDLLRTLLSYRKIREDFNIRNSIIDDEDENANE